MKNKYLWVVSIMGIVLLLDQCTKHFVDTHIRSGMHGAWRSVFFISVTLIALIVIAVLIRKTHERLLVFAFSLIAGGAIGNVIDRVRYGEVVDFIQWYVKSYYWPSFNVADSAISIGVGLLAIDMMFLKKPEPGESTKS
jgi:signal peptidase II